MLDGEVLVMYEDLLTLMDVENLGQDLAVMAIRSPGQDLILMMILMGTS